MRKSDLPFGSEFSPAQIDLPEVLQFANDYAGDYHGFEAAVRERYFEVYDTDDYNRGKLANNTRLGMIAYGIVDRIGNLTSFGAALCKVKDNEKVLYEILAKHILLRLRGMALIQCVEDMETAGEDFNLIKLREWLEDRGIHFPRGGRHPSSMRAWLEKAGIFLPNSWRVNYDRVQEVSGLGTAEFDILSTLSKQQQAFLRTLLNIGEPGLFPSNSIEKLAAATYGVKFNEKNLAKEVLYPLESAGYITLTRGTKQAGRGAKPFMIQLTAKVQAEVLVPALDQIAQLVGHEMRPFLRRSFAEVLEEMSVKDRYQRGLALEALAFKIMRLVDLTYVATRLRGVATGGAEVDLIVEGFRLMFSRWQIQCKNVASGVTLEDVAKEVGLTYVLNSNVIVMVSTGAIGPQARRYANTVMKHSNMDIALLDRADLDQIASDPTKIFDLLTREAKRAMKLKALDIHGDPDLHQGRLIEPEDN